MASRLKSVKGETMTKKEPAAGPQVLAVKREDVSASMINIPLPLRGRTGLNISYRAALLP